MKNRYLFFVILKNHEPWHGAYGPQCLSEKKIMPGHGFLSGNDRPGPRRLALVLFIALNAFFLSGFLFHVGNRNMEYHDALPRKTLITFLGIQYDAENQSCIEQILNGYSAAHNDMLVSYEGIALNVYSRLLNQRLKKDDRTDDVFILPPDCLRPYQRRGRLADQSGLPALTAYRPEVLGQMQVGGRPYIATSSLGARGLFVNLDLPARHGVSTPRNGKAFLAACETFRAKGIIPISADREALKTVLTAVSLTPSDGPIRENAAAFLAALNASPDRLEQVSFLKDASCDMVQGYVFARPMPAGKFTGRLRNPGDTR